MMVELCLMASHKYPPGLVFHPEQSMCRVSKDCQHFLPSPGSRQDMIRSSSFNLRPHQCKEPSKPKSGLPEGNQFVRVDSSFKRPVLIDVQDTRPNSILFSFGIAEQCTRHQKVLEFLTSGSNEVERGGIDISTVSDLMGPQTLTIDTSQLPLTPDYISSFHDPKSLPSLIYPSNEFCSQKPLLDIVGDLACRSDITVHPDGRISFPSAVTEMKDVLSVITEFYLLRNSTYSTKLRKQSVLVPHFDRLDTTESKAGIHGSSLKLETVKVAPLKSPEKNKLKQLPKKKSNKKAGRERDLYKTNYFHACESLLSLMVDNKQKGKTAIRSLKKSGPELPQLLTQFSASVAGTGLAVLFSVVCKVACSRVPFCASKLLNTGFGLGLVLLSWAVNRLRDTIVYISKNSSKMSLKEEEIMEDLDRSLKEIYFRVAALMAVAVLRLA